MTVYDPAHRDEAAMNGAQFHARRVDEAGGGLVATSWVADREPSRAR